MLRVRGLVEGADGDLGAWALRLRGCCECECLWLLLRPGGLHGLQASARAAVLIAAGGRADMSGHVVAAAEAAARLKLETYESTFEVEAPGTGRLGVAFRDSSELWTVTPAARCTGSASIRLLLLWANGRPCGATDESAPCSRPRRTATRSASCSSRGRRRRRSPARRAPRRSPPAELLRGDDGRRARAEPRLLDGEDCFITSRDHATVFEARDRSAAVALARLAPHPHVARLVAWSAPDSVPWAALARVPGQDLESYLKEESFVERVGAAPRWTLETALEVARHVASALAHCHSSAALGGPPLLHRDVKPANVVLEALPAIPLPSTKHRSRFSFGDAPPLSSGRRSWTLGSARSWMIAARSRRTRAARATWHPRTRSPLIWHAVGRLPAAWCVGRVFTKTAVPRPQHQGARGKGHRRAPAPAAPRGRAARARRPALPGVGARPFVAARRRGLRRPRGARRGALRRIA